MAHALCTWAINKKMVGLWPTRLVILQYGPRTHLARGVYQLGTITMPSLSQINITMVMCTL